MHSKETKTGSAELIKQGSIGGKEGPNRPRLDMQEDLRRQVAEVSCSVDWEEASVFTSSKSSVKEAKPL